MTGWLKECEKIRERDYLYMIRTSHYYVDGKRVCDGQDLEEQYISQLSDIEEDKWKFETTIKQDEADTDEKLSEFMRQQVDVNIFNQLTVFMPCKKCRKYYREHNKTF